MCSVWLLKGTEEQKFSLEVEIFIMRNEKSKPSHPKLFGLIFFFYLSKQKHHERIKKKNSIQNFIFLSFLLPSQCCQKPNGGLTFYSACRSGRGKGEKICTWKALGKCSFSWHDPYHVMKSWSHEVRKEVEFDGFTWPKHEKTSHLAHELWGSENRFGRLFSGKYLLCSKQTLINPFCGPSYHPNLTRDSRPNRPQSLLELGLLAYLDSLLDSITS